MIGNVAHVIGPTRALLLAVSFVVLGCGARPSGLPAPVSPKWLTADEAKVLKSGPAEAADSLDAFVVFASDATDDETRAQLVGVMSLTAKLALHRLYYPVDLGRFQHPADDPEFYRALSEFEGRAELKQDGVFTKKEMDSLVRFSALSKDIPMPNNFKNVSLVSGWATASGTWTLKGESIAHPINNVEIDCTLSSRTCIEFDAQISLPDSDSGGAYLYTDTTRYDITSWTGDEVRASLTTSCRKLELVLSVASDSVHQVSTDLTQEGCSITGPLATPRVAVLERGFDVYQRLNKERRELVKKVSRLPMQQIDRLFESPDPKK